MHEFNEFHFKWKTKQNSNLSIWFFCFFSNRINSFCRIYDRQNWFFSYNGKNAHQFSLWKKSENTEWKIQKGENFFLPEYKELWFDFFRSLSFTCVKSHTIPTQRTEKLMANEIELMEKERKKIKLLFSLRHYIKHEHY